MKNKAFTLIELLAVIVILAIIALIATPAVLNIIEDSRKGAAEASARNIINAAKTYYMQSTMNNNTVENIDLSTDTLKYDGDQATKGIVTFENGKASGKMYVGGYCVEVALDGKVSSEKAEEDECTIEVSVPEVTYTKYNDGTPLLYDPVNNVKCTDSEVETNINNFKSTIVGYDDPKITGLQDGCMKWYAFLDSENSSTVNLILDHNTTHLVRWNSGSNGTPNTENELAADIVNWDAEIKATARLISASEINQIAPTNPNWNVDDNDTWYYLNTGTGNSSDLPAGNITYDWLFDNIFACKSLGCTSSDNETSGYWTSTLSSSTGNTWFIGDNGQFCTNGVVFTSGDYGIRPVITVSKSIFK